MIAIKNANLSIVMEDNAQILYVLDASGRKREPASTVSFASVKIGSQILDAQTAVFSDGQLILGFPSCSPLVISVVEKPECMIFTITDCPPCDYVIFARLPFPGTPLMGMALNGFTTGAEWIYDPKEAGMVVCSTKAPSGAQLILARGIAAAQAFHDIKIIGASYAVFAAVDHSALHQLARKVVSLYTTDIPYSRKGGAFATEASNQDLRYSYLLNMTGISEDEVDDWIALAHTFGARQIDFHGGQTFRFGDFFFHPEKYPDGRNSMKKVISRLHDAGLQVGLHTYSQFVSPLSDYVTPCPHPDLAGQVYTLAEDLSTTGKAVMVQEITKGVSAVTGFFVQNSAHLVIDNEIIRFCNTGDNHFEIAARGEFGTTCAFHHAGASVKHLMQEFGLFVPDGDSQLYLDVARRTAEIYNDCDFDMIYLDAIDGTSAVQAKDRSSYDLSWYYANRFVSELMRNVKKEPILEMSAMWHHFWFYRSRMGAWDYSARSHKALLAEHNASNLRSLFSTFMPQNYGWWTYGRADSSDSTQTERIFLDDYEYLASRACKHDWSLAFILSLEDYRSSSELKRAALLIQKYEQYRLSQKFQCVPESNECLLRTSGDIVPITYYRSDSPTREMPFMLHARPEEKLYVLRMENLPTAIMDDPLPLLEAESSNELVTYCSSTVTASVLEGFDASTQRKYLHLCASQKGTLGNARFEKKYPSLLDAKCPRAVGFWVYGDGKNETLDIQLIGPKPMNSGTANYVVTIDFVGWKYFFMYRSNPELLSDGIWPFSGGGHYNDPPYRPEFDIAKEIAPLRTQWHPSRRDVGIYQLTREKLHWNCLESISIILGDMEDQQTYHVYVSEIKAYSMQEKTVKDPVLFFNEHPVLIKGELPPFSYVEWRDGQIVAFDCDGKDIPEIEINEFSKNLVPGENQLYLSDADSRLSLTVGIG